MHIYDHNVVTSLVLYDCIFTYLLSMGVFLTRELLAGNISPIKILLIHCGPLHHNYSLLPIKFGFGFQHCSSEPVNRSSQEHTLL